MDSVAILERLSAIERKLAAVERELVEVATRQTEVTDFINTMKEVVTEMSASPIFKAMGISPAVLSPELPREQPVIPGMSTKDIPWQKD